MRSNFWRHAIGHCGVACAITFNRDYGTLENWRDYWPEITNVRCLQEKLYNVANKSLCVTLVCIIDSGVRVVGPTDYNRWLSRRYFIQAHLRLVSTIKVRNTAKPPCNSVIDNFTSCFDENMWTCGVWKYRRKYIGIDVGPSIRPLPSPFSPLRTSSTLSMASSDIYVDAIFLTK